MKRRDWLEKSGLSSLTLNIGFMEADFSPHDSDRSAAWELYIELLTRITTQSLPPEDGDEQAALGSVHAIFALTREILRKNGSAAGNSPSSPSPCSTRSSAPFTARCHRRSLAGAFQDPTPCTEIRAEWAELQPQLRHYTQALAAMANVEDLTSLEVE